MCLGRVVVGSTHGRGLEGAGGTHTASPPGTCRRTTAATPTARRHRGASPPAPPSASPSASTSAAAPTSWVPKVSPPTPPPGTCPPGCLPGVPALPACPQSATTATASATTATSARHARASPANRGLPRRPTCPSECARERARQPARGDGDGDGDGDFLPAGSRPSPTLGHTWRRTTAATPTTTATAPGATQWTPAPPSTTAPSSPAVSPYLRPCRAGGRSPATPWCGFGPPRVPGSCPGTTLCFLSAAGSTVPSILESAGGGP